MSFIFEAVGQNDKIQTVKRLKRFSLHVMSLEYVKCSLPLTTDEKPTTLQIVKSH